MNGKPTTKSITKKVLIDTLHEFWEQVLEPNLATKVELKDGLNSLDKKLTRKIEKNTRLIEKNSNLIRQNRKEIQGLKVDLSDTPTRKEFNKLEAKVNLHHPTIS